MSECILRKLTFQIINDKTHEEIKEQIPALRALVVVLSRSQPMSKGYRTDEKHNAIATRIETRDHWYSSLDRLKLTLEALEMADRYLEAQKEEEALQSTHKEQ